MIGMQTLLYLSSNPPAKISLVPILLLIFFPLYLVSACVSAQAEALVEEVPQPVSGLLIDSSALADTLLYEALLTAATKGFVLIEQPYQPVDSFGLQWTFSGRKTPLPLRLGFKFNGKILTNQEVLKPWKYDEEFQLKAPDYFWAGGNVTDSCRLRRLDGKWVGSTVIGTGDLGFFVYLSDSLASDGSFLPPTGAWQTGPKIMVLVSDQAYGAKEMRLQPHLFTGTVNPRDAMATMTGHQYGGAIFSVVAASGRIHLCIEAVVVQRFTKDWVAIPIPR